MATSKMICRALLIKKTLISLIIIFIFSLVLSLTVKAYALPFTLSGIKVEQSFSKTSDYTENASFSYKLTRLDKTHPMPEGSTGADYTFAITGSGSVVISDIYFTEYGIYTYEISQLVTAAGKGIDYDSEVYTLTVYVQNGGANYMAAVVICNSSGEKTENIKFENGYAPLATIRSMMSDPPVNKSVTGSPAKSEAFSFKLEAQDKSSPMPEGSVEGVKTVSVMGSGSVEFGTWIYIEPGVYYYTVCEVNNKVDGYRYDTMVYTITDVVIEKNNQLLLSRTVTNASGKAVSSLDFVNHYTPLQSSTDSDMFQSMGSSPNTGDDSFIMVYLIIFLMSVLVLLICIAYLIYAHRC